MPGTVRWTFSPEAREQLARLPVAEPSDEEWFRLRLITRRVRELGRARATCRTHMKSCSWCGGHVCTDELPDEKCLTCRSLSTAEDRPDDVIASIGRLPGELRPKQRLVARDGGRFVVQLDLGWTRRVVVTIPHGDVRANRVLRHSLFGSRAET